MEKLYALSSTAGAEEYITLEGEEVFDSLSRAYQRDERQYISKEPVQFGLSDEGGLEVPDVLIQEGILFVSSRCRELLLVEGQDYLLFKRADVKDDRFGIHETFWIVVPPRVDCLDLSKSEFEQEEDLEWNCREGLIPLLMPDRIRINPARAGYYGMFRLFGVADQTIYVREELCQKLTAAGFKALELFEAVC